MNTATVQRGAAAPFKASKLPEMAASILTKHDLHHFATVCTIMRRQIEAVKVVPCHHVMVGSAPV